MTDDDKRVVTLQEARARREQKKYAAAGLDTMLDVTSVRFEAGEKPSDLIQKMIDLYTRIQVASGIQDGSDEYVVTPIAQVLHNLWNIKELFNYAEHFAMSGMDAPTSRDIGELKVSVERPLDRAPYQPPPRHLPFLHVVEGCASCPMEYDGGCNHPKAPTGRERLSDCDDWVSTPHPRCPLRGHPVFMRTRS